MKIKTDRTTPFRILIDTAEQAPWTFLSIRSDADKDYAPFTVPTRSVALGRYPDSLGDYSVDGFVGRVAIERKSKDDLIGTVLGFNDGRRKRFESELANLSKVDASIVIVEATREQCLEDCADFGMKEAKHQRKILSRSIAAYQMDYQVQWMFCINRRDAEIYAFHWLERFWRKNYGKQRGGSSVA